MNIALALIIPLIAFFFESYPRLINKKYGVDVWTHLLYLKEYHRQKGIPKKITHGFLVTGDYDYPPAFIYILSKFPFKLVEKYEFFFSPFFDALHLVIIFFLSYFITQNVYIALFTQLLYVLTPIIIIENSSATPRSLGYTLLTVTLTSQIYFVMTGNLYLLLLAIVTGSLIFLSHRFTAQGFLFLTIIFSIILRDHTYLLVFVLSLTIAIIFSRGFYLKVLRGHLGNLYFWHKNIKYRFYHQVKGEFKKNNTNDFVFKVYNQFLKFPPFVLTITNVWTIPVLYITITYFPNGILGVLVLWVLSTYILSLLTIWIPQLRFLGEGQRYLELSAFPAALIASNFLFSYADDQIFFPISILYVIAALGSFITIITIQRKAIINDKLRTLIPAQQKMYSYLKGLKNKPNLLCIPHQITTNTIYHTDCPVFVNADYTNIQAIAEVYPYLRKPVATIMKKYHLDMILLNEDYATTQDLKIKTYEEVKRFDNYVLIRVQ